MSQTKNTNASEHLPAHLIAKDFSDFGRIYEDSPVMVISMPLVLPPEAQRFVDNLDIQKTGQRWHDLAPDAPSHFHKSNNLSVSQKFNHTSRTTQERVGNWITSTFGGGNVVAPHSLNPAHRMARDPEGLDAFSSAFANVLQQTHTALQGDYEGGEFQAKGHMPGDSKRNDVMRYHNVDTALIINLRGPSTEFALQNKDDIYDKYAGEVPGAFQHNGPTISVHRYRTWHAATVPPEDGRLIYIAAGSPSHPNYISPDERAAAQLRAQQGGWLRRTLNRVIS